MERWHADIRDGIDLDQAVADTTGWSYAEIEELKNLLILGYMDSGRWDWLATLKQWEVNRHDLSADRKRAIGFHCNGQAITH